MSTLVDQMRAEADRIEEDSLYSCKGHFEAARFWAIVHLWLGLPAAALAAVASASAFKDEAVLAGALALAAAVLSAVSTFLNASERSQLHHQAGAKYASLRNRARMFRELDLLSGAGEPDLVASLKGLGGERDDLNQSQPQIPKFAFARARRGIEGGEATYAVDVKTK